MRGQNTRMDRQYFWKRTEEIETDLTELLRSLIRQWKRIAACALAAAMVLGGAAWLKDRGTDVQEPGITAEGLTEAEEQGIADAAELKNKIQELETYLDHSILMQADSYHKNEYIMLFGIDHAAWQEQAEITESYLNFILNGGAADALIKAGRNQKADKSCLAEVISAYQKTYDLPYRISADMQPDSAGMPGTLFYVEVTGKSAESAEKMARDIQAALEEYSDGIKETLGRHRLHLVSSAESVTMDSGLQSLQSDKKSQLSSMKANLKAATDAFSKEQKRIYIDETGAEDEEGEEDEEDEGDASETGFGSIARYICLGFAGGLFAYCGIFSCWYLFGGQVKSMEEMKRLYTFSVYGEILLNGRGGAYKKAGAEKTAKDHGRGKAQVLNRIRIFCKKHGVTEICAASDFSFHAKEKECLDEMAEQLKTWGIRMTAAENASADPAVWDKLAETGNILMVCRIGTTTYRMIDDAMGFYSENGIAVTGAAVFS